MAHKKLTEALLERLRRRDQWDEADARTVIAALERSESPVSAFAEAHALPANRLYYWRTRVGAMPAKIDEDAALSFAPVVVTGLGRKPVLSIRGAALEVDVFEPEGVEPAWLARLCASVRGEG